MISGRSKARNAGRVQCFMDCANEFVLYSKGNMEPWKLCKKNSDVVRLVFSIVPFGSSVHDELGGISSEAIGIM